MKVYPFFFRGFSSRGECGFDVREVVSWNTRNDGRHYVISLSNGSTAEIDLEAFNRFIEMLKNLDIEK